MMRPTVCRRFEAICAYNQRRPLIALLHAGGFPDIPAGLNIDDQLLFALYHVSARGTRPVQKGSELYRAYPSIKVLQDVHHRKPLNLLKGRPTGSGAMANVKVTVCGDAITLTPLGVAEAVKLLGK